MRSTRNVASDSRTLCFATQPLALAKSPACCDLAILEETTLDPEALDVIEL